MGEPWQRDPTGLFYVPPGNEYAKSCLLLCGLLIAWIAITIAVASVAGPVIAVAAAVVMLVVGWNWDWDGSRSHKRNQELAAENWARVEQEARVKIAAKADKRDEEMRNLRSLLPEGWTLDDPAHIVDHRYAMALARGPGDLLGRFEGTWATVIDQADQYLRVKKEGPTGPAFGQAAPGQATLGEQVAEWLRERVDPSRIYDHKILTKLQPIGITYLSIPHLMYMLSGEFVSVPTYTVAELRKHPVVEFSGLSDKRDARWMPGFEIASTLHRLLWPGENPPGNPRQGWVQAFQMDVLSIAHRGATPDTPEVSSR